jgi:sedoheptulose-bisphosphatase
VYVNLSSKLQKKKLRLLYETLPLSFLVQKAGGLSSDGEKCMLDVPIVGYY